MTSLYAAGIGSYMISNREIPAFSYTADNHLYAHCTNTYQCYMSPLKDQPDHIIKQIQLATHLYSVTKALNTYIAILVTKKNISCYIC